MTTDTAKIETPPLDTEAATRQQDPWNAGFMGPILTNDPLLLERAEHGSRAFELYRDLKRDGKVLPCSPVLPSPCGKKPAHDALIGSAGGR